MLERAREVCDAHDALLVVDEAQTGIGRLGEWYGWQTTSVVPDVICLAKGLANGLPIGAILAHGVAAKAFQPGDHASTFGGNPVACAAANAVMDVIDREDLLANTRAMGQRLADGLITLDSPHVVGQRGRGLLRALLLDAPVSAAVTGHALEQLLVVNNVASDAVRLAPPLNVTPDEIDEGLRRLGLALSAATHENGTS